MNQLFPLITPFSYTRTLRNYLRSILKVKLKINDELRNYSKNNPGTKITESDFIKTYYKSYKVLRKKIPDNMKYNQHTRNYWAINPKGSKDECIRLWYQSKGIRSF